MTTKDFERIDSLLKLCEEHQKNLRASLQKTTQRVMEVKTQMNIRCTQIWGKLEHIRERFDKIHRSNQSFLDKIKEKLDEINAQEMEANRENDEFRRKAVFIRRQRRKHGLIRSIGSSIYNYGISILTFIGWYKPVKKAQKETKKQQELHVSPSQHTLTVVFPEKSTAATTTKTVNKSSTPPLKKLQ